MDRSALTEIGVSGLVIAICAVVLWQTLSLPPGSFEPLGSAPVPQATAAIIILCCLVVIARAVSRLRSRNAGDAPQAPPATSPASALIIFAGALVYVAALHSRLVHFGMLTFLFLIVVIWALERFRRRALLPAALVAAVVGFGSHYVFTQFFVVDLPG